MTFYKLLVRAIRCSSLALSFVIHRAIVQWLRNQSEARAAEWFEKYWTGVRGNYMLAHSEIGGTNNNNGTEGNWAGLKKAGFGTAGATAGLPVRSVLPSLLHFLSDKG